MLLHDYYATYPLHNFIRNSHKKLYPIIAGKHVLLPLREWDTGNVYLLAKR